MPISLPTLEQQQSIAVILSTVDEKIDVIDEQIAATTQLKQGLMQQLLTKGIGQTKFKSSPLGEIPESWEVVKLGEIYKKLSSGSTPSRRITEYYKGDILWITSGELNYNVITDTKEKITIDAVKDTNLKIHPPGTFFIAITGLEAAGTRGRCGINGIEATTNQSCMAFHANGRVDTNYLFHYYKGYGSNLAFDYAQGTKQQSFNGKILANILIKLPPVTEQKEIAEILSAVETKVEALKEKKVYYQELKQGLMQQLLTGKIRVNQTEPELATLDVAV